ncbi:transposase [Caballeronia terrestris]|uniref:Transposase n=1 Tax=Caballeronia terrestris TaxID=1226301 RepID=A0A158KEG2_9BURK|nr:transposase [Caballeronia terrestris]SAL79405.1 transposase [Caballeronia terrestris]
MANIDWTGLVGMATGVFGAVMGFIDFRTGIVQLKQGIVTLVNDADDRITILLRRLGSMCLEQLAALQRWLDDLASEIAGTFKRNESCQRLATVPGIGPLVATALFSGAGNPLQFNNGRLAAWLGLTPMQRSSGGKSKLSGITKHGDKWNERPTKWTRDAEGVDPRGPTASTCPIWTKDACGLSRPAKLLAASPRSIFPRAAFDAFLGANGCWDEHDLPQCGSSGD